MNICSVFISNSLQLLYIANIRAGVMPEVKRREIQRRKDRRERLWRDDDDGSGAAGGGALRRTAKKILVKQLKELREKEARSKKRGGKKGASAEEEKKTDNSAGSQSHNGGLAAGFTLEDDEAAEPSDKKMSNSDKADGKNDDVISINSKDSRDQLFEPLVEQYEAENDWEMSRAVQESINDSIQQQQKPSSDSNENVNGTSRYNSDANPFDHEHYQQAANETIASLPCEARSKWINSQRAAQRIQSRQECIKAAADPEDYSRYDDAVVRFLYTYAIVCA